MKKKSLVSLMCVLFFVVGFVLVGNASAETVSKTAGEAAREKTSVEQRKDRRDF
jgi:hypothetical protein